MKYAKGKYLAMMDCDDIALPQRFAKQVSSLESNKDVGICGSYASILNKESIIKTPIKTEDIRVMFLKDNCFVHPSVMMRTEMIMRYSLIYDENYYFASDYDFLSRAISFFPIINIPEVLLIYRRHENQISTANYEQQQVFADQIRLNQLNYLHLNLNSTEADDHLFLFKGKKDVDLAQLNRLHLWVNKIRTANQNIAYYDNHLLSSFLNEFLKKIKRSYDMKVWLDN